MIIFLALFASAFPLWRTSRDVPHIPQVCVYLETNEKTSKGVNSLGWEFHLWFFLHKICCSQCSRSREPSSWIKEQETFRQIQSSR
jgi:hypothetical protein